MPAWRRWPHVTPCMHPPPRPPPRSQPAARQLYKDHLSFMMGRANTITGQPYSSDPAIYGLDVLNEPR